jgi:hypothetical protein
MEAVAPSLSEANPGMPYQIIDAVMARAVQDDAARTSPSFAWIIMRPKSPDLVVARLVTDGSTPYILVGHTLAEVQAQLPPGLTRTERQPSYPPEVVEIWFPEYDACASLGRPTRSRHHRNLNLTITP